MKCRKRIGDIKTGEESLTRDESEGCLFIAQVVSGIEVARVWHWRLRGTWEPVVLILWSASGMFACGRSREGVTQAAETVRVEYRLRGTGTDRPVVVVKPGNAGGAKGTGYPGSFVCQLLLGGMSL